MLRRANALGARVCLILGDREIDEGRRRAEGPRRATSQEKVPRAESSRGAAVVASPAPRRSRMKRRPRDARLTAILRRDRCSRLRPRSPTARSAACGRRRAAAAVRAGATQTRPTRNKPVGPQRGPGRRRRRSARAVALVASRSASPPVQTPQDPLAIPEARRDASAPTTTARLRPEGKVASVVLPLLRGATEATIASASSRRSISSTRAASIRRPAQTTPQTDRESLAALLFYQRRSPQHRRRHLLPRFWRVRDRQNHVLVLGPLAHREAPNEHDNWLAPLVFEGSRKDGGYFHSPLAAHDVALGREGRVHARRSVLPRSHAARRRLGHRPVLLPRRQRRPRRRAQDVHAHPAAPLLPSRARARREQAHRRRPGHLGVQPEALRSSTSRRCFFTIRGKPETGGVRESHTRSSRSSTTARARRRASSSLPGYLRRVTQTADTLITPFFTHATTRNNATSTDGGRVRSCRSTTATPTSTSATARSAIFPFFYGSSSPKGRTLLDAALRALRELQRLAHELDLPQHPYTRDSKGWETDIHPHRLPRSQTSARRTRCSRRSSGTSRARRVAPRSASRSTGASRTRPTARSRRSRQHALPQRRVPGGIDWQFHLLPIFSYGQSPPGYWWNVLFGLAGYDREGDKSTIKAFWLPITVSGGANTNATDAADARVHSSVHLGPAEETPARRSMA